MSAMATVAAAYPRPSKGVQLIVIIVLYCVFEISLFHCLLHVFDGDIVDLLLTHAGEPQQVNTTVVLQLSKGTDGHYEVQSTI